MSSKGHILIASTALDKINFENVESILKKSNFDVIAYETDKVARGLVQFEAHLKNGQLLFNYDNRIINLEKVNAAWYRKPTYYGQTMDQLRWLSLKDEYMAAHNNLIAAIDESAWLNLSANMSAAEIKLPQLAVAAKVGFKVLETIVSNSWEAVETLPTDTFIVKMAKSGMVPSRDHSTQKIMHTSVLKRDNLPKQAIPYPGIWQPYQKKKREWCVTVVGDKVFSAAIYTKKEAQDDWRKHQFTDGAVTFKAEPFPEDLAQKCKALLKHYGLRYGAFDFIETPQGEMIFLEVNPNGQFMWLEKQLGLPISEAIADELIKIAESKT